MNRRVKTVAQAMALPEIGNPYWVEHRRTLDADGPMGRRGDMVIERTPRPFAPGGVHGDDILLFVDADGRAMQVVQTVEGPAKTLLRL